MLQSQTVLTGHEAKSGTSAKGAWTRHVFTDQSGIKFQTFKTDIANVAFGLLNQAVVVSYEETQNGDYVNNELRSVVSANGAAPVAAAAPQGAPQASPVTTAPTQTGESEAQKTARIVRMASLKIAYATVAALSAQGADLSAVENAANDMARRIFQISMGKSAASAPQGQAAPPPSPGGGAAGAPAVTPAPAVPVASAPAPGAPVVLAQAPQGADDDIPF